MSFFTYKNVRLGVFWLTEYYALKIILCTTASIQPYTSVIFLIDIHIIFNCNSVVMYL